MGRVEVIESGRPWRRDVCAREWRACNCGQRRDAPRALLERLARDIREGTNPNQRNVSTPLAGYSTSPPVEYSSAAAPSLPNSPAGPVRSSAVCVQLAITASKPLVSFREAVAPTSAGGSAAGLTANKGCVWSLLLLPEPMVNAPAHGLIRIVRETVRPIAPQV